MSVNERELCLVDVAVAVASTLQVGPSRRCQHLFPNFACTRGSAEEDQGTLEREVVSLGKCFAR